MLKSFETTTRYLSLSFSITIPGSLRRTIVVSNQTEGVMVHQGTEVLFSYTIVTMMLMIIMKKKMFMNLATNQVNKALGHHSNVDDHHAEENVDAPDAQPGGALLPNR